MSNFFFVDSYGNATVDGYISVDGYTINPSNAVTGQVLQYNGNSYVAATIQEGDVSNLVTDLNSKVPTTRNINTVSGQLVGGGNLSADKTLGLDVSGVTAGTYTSVTVDAYGRVTAGSNPSSGISGSCSTNQVVYGSGTNTVQSSSNLTFDGTVLGAKHIKGLGTAPTGSIGTSALTGGSVSVTGSDVAGVITLTISGWQSSGAYAGNTFFTVNFNTSFASKPYVFVWPMNLAAFFLMASSSGKQGNIVTTNIPGWYLDDANVSTSSFSLKFGTSSFGSSPPTDTCLFYYHVIG